jgi:CubicO group peptidase (beta-lactamase class C family)
MNVRACAFLASFGLALLGCSDETPSNPAPRSSELARELQNRLDAAEGDGFSGAVRVSIAGEPIVSEGRGLANRERALENAEHTAFDMGSIMKGFTAVAIFQLEEEGALSLDDTLDGLLPDVPPDKADITLREIVQHRAGFDAYHDTLGDFEPMTKLEARARILSQELLFPPGEREEYSNSGYTLLADIIEAVSQTPYTEYVHDRLFAPAGMVESGFYSEPIWQSVDTAIGYEAETFGANDPASWPYTWALVGNGGLVTTVSDLDRWVGALFSGKIVKPATLERIESGVLEEGAAEVEGEILYGEAGAGDFGLGGVLIYAPGQDLRVTIGSNTYDAFDVEEFAVELTTLVLAADTAKR